MTSKLNLIIKKSTGMLTEFYILDLGTTFIAHFFSFFQRFVLKAVLDHVAQICKSRLSFSEYRLFSRLLLLSNPSTIEGLVFSLLAFCRLHLLKHLEKPTFLGSHKGRVSLSPIHRNTIPYPTVAILEHSLCQ